MGLWRRELFEAWKRRRDTAKKDLSCGEVGGGGGYGFRTFARDGERSKSGVGASTLRSGSPATTAPLAAPLAAAAT